MKRYRQFYRNQAKMPIWSPYSQEGSFYSTPTTGWYSNWPVGQQMNSIYQGEASGASHSNVASQTKDEIKLYDTVDWTQNKHWSQRPDDGDDWIPLPQSAQNWSKPSGENWNYLYERPDVRMIAPMQPTYYDIPKEPSNKEVQQAVGKQYLYLKPIVLEKIQPWVNYGLRTIETTPYEFIMTKIVMITYLLGRGYGQNEVKEFIESWGADSTLTVNEPILTIIAPWVPYGINEASYTSTEHALTEVASITYLLGQGYDPQLAHYIVESWETLEHF